MAYFVSCYNNRVHTIKRGDSKGRGEAVLAPTKRDLEEMLLGLDKAMCMKSAYSFRRSDGEIVEIYRNVSGRIVINKKGGNYIALDEREAINIRNEISDHLEDH